MSRLRSRVVLLSVLLVWIFSIAGNTQQSAQPPQRPQIDWQAGPTTAQLGDIAELKVPVGYRFTGKAGTMKVLELTQNIPNGRELGTLVSDDPKSNWFMLFEFEDTGYIKDDDKDSLDASAILKNIQEATDAANQERQKHGWKPFHVTGWEKAPYYDPATHNLTWAFDVRGEDPTDKGDVNHRIRLLGRKGTMNVDLVAGPAEYAAGVAEFNSLISGFSYKSGSRYSDFKSGDKVAEYGLAALIAGGAGAVALKTGLLAKLWKFIVVGIAAIGAAIKKFFKAIFGGNETKVEDPSKNAAAQG